ncbi:ion transporter [Putridiphycobacter roseus]|uniref:Ion transporter n=1 Tax=Putridiphycobacter roseus TaxID=2219161 RepID=A0A2W1N0G9_9FLAO|nr:ion transporter [Putridiphycobacter roseus]PZE17707.1 ion transporter [Putridiphycobacter roseus]
MSKAIKKSNLKPWQEKIHEVIFEADTFAGKTFDIGLLIAIIVSIIIVMLESVPSLNEKYHDSFYLTEWIFTIIFTLEYVARIISIGKPNKYILSFYGIIDLLSILPTYLGLFIIGSQSLMVIRAVRLLRIFRILKLARFVKESKTLGDSIKASRHRILVFLLAVLTLSTILGTIMYLVESSEAGFTSIPRSIYWAIITLTTVGYGDIAPITPMGQFIASIVMIMGYAILAVPTGIITSEFIKTNNQPQKISTKSCNECSSEGHDEDAIHCKYCGAEL